MTSVIFKILVKLGNKNYSEKGSAYHSQLWVDCKWNILMNSYVFNTIFASNTLFMVMKNEEFLEKYEILEKNKQYKKKMIVNIYINNSAKAGISIWGMQSHMHASAHCLKH